MDPTNSSKNCYGLANTRTKFLKIFQHSTNWFELSMFRNVVMICCDVDINSPFLKVRTVVILKLHVSFKQTLLFGLTQVESRLGLALARIKPGEHVSVPCQHEETGNLPDEMQTFNSFCCKPLSSTGRNSNCTNSSQDPCCKQLRVLCLGSLLVEKSPLSLHLA